MKIFCEGYDFLNRCCINTKTKSIIRKRILLIYNEYIDSNILKPFFEKLFQERKIYSLDFKIYYSNRVESNCENSEDTNEYRRTYVYIIFSNGSKGIYFTSSTFTIDLELPSIRVIEGRDDFLVKKFMCDGSYYKEDIQDMINLSDSLGISCYGQVLNKTELSIIAKKTQINCGNNKIINRKSRFSKDDDNSTIDTNESYNLYNRSSSISKTQDCHSVSSVSNMSNETELGKAITMMKEQILENNLLLSNMINNNNKEEILGRINEMKEIIFENKKLKKENGKLKSRFVKIKKINLKKLFICHSYN